MGSFSMKVRRSLAAGAGGSNGAASPAMAVRLKGVNSFGPDHTLLQAAHVTA